jgi:hypothetical protein
MADYAELSDTMTKTPSAPRSRGISEQSRITRGELQELQRKRETHRARLGGIIKKEQAPEIERDEPSAETSRALRGRISQLPVWTSGLIRR